MAGFIGKWEIQSSENFSEYMSAIGVAEEKKAEALKFLGDGSKMSFEISNCGDEWEFRVGTQAGEKNIKFSLGKEFDTFTLDGRPIKTTFSLDGGNLKECQKGDGFETINVRTVDGDCMTMTMTGNGVTCTRKYKKV
ncbi:LOW QUALITY PROTEIN: sodium/calcium exchanger regulatory protein 1-like [Pecten maximus]|uniref:LOW QUALITY PROTEIN: sodium/calcium exchanger regulatory protein 1-like n=1 Tax=Pecten maximus TaxID=6579 RepID=UPI0014590F2B|nr:LOW QUALITY PROTEIN: sodium/calcium exchanger regulatory protein 1-like [Pecten maximus]